MSLKHIWMSLMGILRVYLNQWLPFSFMLIMLLYFLNLEHACKDLWTSYMSFSLSLALMSIHLFQNYDFWLHQTYLKLIDKIEIFHEYKNLGICLYSHDHFDSSSKRQQIACMKALIATFSEGSNNRSHILGTQITSIQGFRASNFHIWHWDLGRWLRKLSLQGFSRRAWRYIWCLKSKHILQQSIIFCWPNLEKLPYNYMLLS